jgi:hypothetical protein
MDEGADCAFTDSGLAIRKTIDAIKNKTLREFVFIR